MLTEALLLKVAKAAVLLAEGEVKRAALAHVRGAIREFSNDERFRQAAQADREQILWTLHEVVIEVARAIFDRKLDGDQAVQALLELARDPQTGRAFRALLGEAGVSDDERVAMLAVGYFVGAESPTLRDRLNASLRGLFPEDASVLGTLVEQASDIPMADLVAVAVVGQDQWRLAGCLQGRVIHSLGASVSPHALRALSAAHCIELERPRARAGEIFLSNPQDGQIDQVFFVHGLPLGRELHRVLDRVDWREIARRRAPSAIV